MRYNITREELMLLFDALVLPEMVKKRFAEDSLMQAVIPLREGGPISYHFNALVLAAMSDEVLRTMHSEQRRFCRWYWAKHKQLQFAQKVENAACVFAERFLRRYLPPEMNKAP